MFWKYWPDDGRKRGECPCHGSMYDPITGTAFVGPASVQAAPSDTLPKLILKLIQMDLCLSYRQSLMQMKME